MRRSKELLLDRIPEKDRNCLNCRHFTFNPIRPRRLNRECCYGIDAEGNTKPVETGPDGCRMWRDTRTFMMKLRGRRPNKRLY